MIKQLINRDSLIMHKIIISIFLLLASFHLQAEVVNLSNTEVKQMIQQGVPVIDIRRANEWQQTGIIEGSHLLTFFDKKGHYNLDSWMSEFKKIAGPDDPFILICRSGNRTGQIGKVLSDQLHYKKVAHVARGIKNWKALGEPTVAP